MVAPKAFLLTVAGGIIGVAPLASAQRLFDDKPISLRDFDSTYYTLGPTSRSFDLPLSLYDSYIDEKIELALREHDNDIYDDLAPRHTRTEITRQVKKWKEEAKKAKPLVRAVRRN
jgi:hypothetical protein